MSEATALGRSTDYSSGRRWQRYKVNVPIRVIVCRAMRASIFDGRGTSLSEGGMALFAGAELRPGDQVAVEFTPPFSTPPIRVDAMIAIGPVITMGWSFWRVTTPREKASSCSACTWGILPSLAERNE